jgi:putative transposase
MSERRARISSEQALPVTRQCELLDVSRSTAYHRPQPVSEADLARVGGIDRGGRDRPDPS